MRPLGLLLPVLLSLSLHAAQVRFSSDHLKIFAGQTPSVFIHNEGDDDALDLRVDIELSPELYFTHEILVSREDWICTLQSGTRATCTTPRLRSGDYLGISFNVSAVHTRGGRHTATATLTARNVNALPPIVFDVISHRFDQVTTAADFGAGSLRDAIESVNADPLCGTEVPCLISIRENLTIAPATPLPAIRKCNVRLSGWNDLEFEVAVKRAVISGENATWGNGLEIRAACAEGVSGVWISSIAVHSWPWNGIYVESAGAPGGSHLLERMYVGTDAAGLVAKPNGGRGVVLDSPHDGLSIAGGIVSGNARSGIATFRGRGLTVSSVKIGVSRTLEPLGNGASGVFTFGVPLSVHSGTVAHNAHAGVAIARGTTEALAGGDIHSNGGLPIDWALDGPTPPDDETDGILNAPQIRDAFFDAGSNTTVVLGTLRLRANAFTGNEYRVSAFVTRDSRGDFERGSGAGAPRVFPPAEGVADVPWEIRIAGDLRGKFIASQTVLAIEGKPPHLSSEIGEARQVR